MHHRDPAARAPRPSRSPAIIPAPRSHRPLPGDAFELTATSRIAVSGGAEAAIADRFAWWLRRSTGFALPLASEREPGDIVVELDAAVPSPEGYTLRVTTDVVTITAATAEGMFRGLTTLRQLLPAAAEASTVQPGPWTIAGIEVADGPRFEYRGTMLDVARHFVAVDDVLRYIDLISHYKVNVLHLHLTDDQGWRLTVPAWPRLTTIGSASDIDGGAGGCYSPDDYARIIEYAAERFVEVVPEIDGPGHTSAALVAYPELTCDGVAPPPFHRAGISAVSLCASATTTYAFLGDVFDTLVAERGRYIHLGGDEAIGTNRDDFDEYVSRTAALVIDRGRAPVMWHEAAAATLPPGSVVQYWGVGQGEETALARRAVEQGARVILSPANHAYLDQKYDSDTELGLAWAGHVPVSASYAWDPATVIDGVAEESILGVESALWTETVRDRDEIDHLAFPRIAGVAELGWSPAASLGWDGYRTRLAAQGPRWDLLGVNYYRSPEVPWPE